MNTQFLQPACTGIIDMLTKEDRANDLDRESGRAFLLDCLNPDGNGNCL